MAYKLEKFESTKGLDYPWPADIIVIYFVHSEYKNLYTSAEGRKNSDFTLCTIDVYFVK